MIKASTNFTLAWELIIILLISTILILLSYSHLKNFINDSNFLWVIYFYTPGLIAFSYAIYEKKNILRFFSCKIEVIMWYRYFLFLAIVAGIVFISFVLALTTKMTPVLLFQEKLIIISKNFSFMFYFKGIILSPAIEEIIFRGIILSGFLTRYSPIKAIMLSSLFFSLFHINITQFPPTFLVGLLCGWYFWKTRNLLSCIIIHSLYNLISLTAVNFFIDNQSQQFIKINSSLFQIENLWLLILMSITLIIVGLFYLYISLKDNPEEKYISD